MRQILNMLHILNSNRIKNMSMWNGVLNKDFNLEYSPTKQNVSSHILQIIETGFS